MSTLTFNLDCPGCGSHFTAHFTTVAEDDTITCPCGYNFPLSASGRAEMSRVVEERTEEILEIHADVISTCK